MTVDEARQHALGYAAGREDASGVETCASKAEPHRPGFMAFADAFAKGEDDYRSGRRYNMIPARDAYSTWQARQGAGIFPQGQETPHPARS